MDFGNLVAVGRSGCCYGIVFLEFGKFCVAGEGRVRFCFRNDLSLLLLQDDSSRLGMARKKGIGQSKTFWFQEEACRKSEKRCFAGSRTKEYRKRQNGKTSSEDISEFHVDLD